jgi:hypothetical protein
MAAKKKKATKSTREPYKGNDAVVVVNVFAPDYEPQEFKMTIPNIRGNAMHNHRTPERVVGAMMGGLMSKYGKTVR